MDDIGYSICSWLFAALVEKRKRAVQLPAHIKETQTHLLTKFQDKINFSYVNLDQKPVTLLGNISSNTLYGLISLIFLLCQNINAQLERRFFSMFRFFCTLGFQIYPNKPDINWKLIYSTFRWCINLNFHKQWPLWLTRVTYINVNIFINAKCLVVKTLIGLVCPPKRVFLLAMRSIYLVSSWLLSCVTPH